MRIVEYCGYTFSFEDSSTWRDILLAYLSELPFESFSEEENGNLVAYIDAEIDKVATVQTILDSLSHPIQFTRKVIPRVNWNAEWENHFEPIAIGNKCRIRAEFHEPDPNVEMEIVIQPKMSFGTGHHETTQLILEFLVEEDFTGLNVLDMGCGTGVLGICAKLRGAENLVAIDIDDWAYENTRENAARNQAPMQVFCGGAELLGNQKFDWILANINKNILIRDIPIYLDNLKSGGTLVLSGLLDVDFDDILSVTTENGAKFEKKLQKNEWIALRFSKP